MHAVNHNQQNDVLDLGTIGGSHSVASDFNVNTEIVGTSSTSGRYVHAFYWKNSKMIDLGTGGNHSSSANGINKSGVIVGDVISGGIRGTIRGAQWKGGKLIELPLWRGSKHSRATSINDKGQIVGVMAIGSREQEAHACLWEGNKITDLGMLPDDIASTASKINARSQIVGYSLLKDDGPNRLRACLWTQGKVIDLGPPGTQESQALAINDEGIIVGYFQIQKDKPDTHACLFRNGTVTDLGGLADCYLTKALGINNAMQIVGRSCNFVTDRKRAFLWDNGKMVDLNDRIDSGTGWVLESATAINDKGEIVGYGSIKGEKRAFLLKPRAMREHNGREKLDTKTDENKLLT